jgi:hypothetical protein
MYVPDSSILAIHFQRHKQLGLEFLCPKKKKKMLRISIQPTTLLVYNTFFGFSERSLNETLLRRLK